MYAIHHIDIQRSTTGWPQTVSQIVAMNTNDGCHGLYGQALWTDDGRRNPGTHTRFSAASRFARVGYLQNELGIFFNCMPAFEEVHRLTNYHELFSAIIELEQNISCFENAPCMQELTQRSWHMICPEDYFPIVEPPVAFEVDDPLAVSRFGECIKSAPELAGFLSDSMTPGVPIIYEGAQSGLIQVRIDATSG